MKNLRLTIVFLVLGLHFCACSESSERRDPTVLDLPTISSLVAANIPGAFSNDATDASSELCSDCATIGESIKPLFNSEAAGNYLTMLSAIDEKTAAFETRMTDHYVPCLEDSAKSITTEFTETHTVSSSLNCYGHFQNPDDSESATNYGQISFGLSGGAYSAVNRLGSINGYSTSIWTNRDNDSNLEIWYSSDQSMVNTGITLSHLKSFTSGEVEYATAGKDRYQESDPLVCGVQMRFNDSHIYVSGKFVAMAEVECPSHEVSCDDLTTETYCLSASDFGAADQSNCEDAGLTTFELTAISDADLTSETWSEDVRFDSSGDIPRFELEGLEVY